MMVLAYWHGPLRRKHSFLGWTLKVVLVPTVSEQLKVWLEQVRARIVPCKLLQHLIRAIVTQNQSTDVGTVARGIGGIIIVNSALPAGSFSEAIDETERIGNLGNFIEQMVKFIWVKELNVQITATVQTASTLVKLVPSAERVKETS